MITLSVHAIIQNETEHLSVQQIHYGTSLFPAAQLVLSDQCVISYVMQSNR